jgi:murein DD-endopeptidase MepM/ murein hydrolase activator NlpD
MSGGTAFSSQSYGHPKAAAQAAVRRQPPRQRGAHQAVAGAGYTIAHRGRQVRFGPVAFWIAVGTVVVMAGWSITTATYFAFRDDVLKGLMARQASQQYAYEDRIAELRAQIDRASSRQLLDQEQLDQKLDDLIRRQAVLESHATALGNFADPASTGSIKPAPGGAAGSNPRSVPLGNHTMLEPDRMPNRQAGKDGETAAKLAQVETSLDRVEHSQSTALVAIEQRYESKAARIRSVLAQLGLNLDPKPQASGGPFVPLPLPSESQSFERALSRATVARAYANKLDAVLLTVPVREPVTGEIDFTSPFGVRMDPFLHVEAMHTGLDFRGTIGEPIHATAAGTVTNAGWSGGYGNMVEVDHGNGLATRYGHMSEIDVKVGQSIRIGQVLGRIGSTGRSTGPHLHYETRVEGEAVDPHKFLAAGAKLFGG